MSYTHLGSNHVVTYRKTQCKVKPNVLTGFGLKSLQRFLVKQGFTNRMIKKWLYIWIVKKAPPLGCLWSSTGLLKQRIISNFKNISFFYSLKGKQDLGINSSRCQEAFLRLRELFLRSRPLRSERNRATDEEHTGLLHRTVGFLVCCGYDTFPLLFQHTVSPHVLSNLLQA